MDRSPGADRRRQKCVSHNHIEIEQHVWALNPPNKPRWESGDKNNGGDSLHVSHFNLPALDGSVGIRGARNVPTKLFAGRSLVEFMRRKATGACHFGCVWMVGTIEKRCGISRAFDNLIQSQFHNSVP
jgi:hypothetical protein